MCSVTGIKVLLFIENFLFWLVGSGLIGAGLYILLASDLPGILQLLKGAATLCYVAIGVGAFLFFLGLIGCCGAAYHNECLLKTYITVLILIILAEVGAGVYIGLGFGTAQLESIWNSIDTTSKSAVEKTFQCCGFTNDVTIITPTCADPYFYNSTEGCYDKITAAIQELDTVVLSVGVSIAVLELLGIVMSCFLACNKKEIVDNRVMPMQPRGGYVNSGYHQ